MICKTYSMYKLRFRHQISILNTIIVFFKGILVLRVFTVFNITLKLVPFKISPLNNLNLNSKKCFIYLLFLSYLYLNNFLLLFYLTEKNAFNLNL